MKLYLFSILIFVVLNLISINLISKGFDFSGIKLDHVVIRGSSNVSDFKLVYVNDHSVVHQIVPDENTDNSIYFKIPVEYITAANHLMVSDFRALIHADKYPEIEIAISKNQIESIINDDQNESIQVKIIIAGKANLYTIPFFMGKLPGSYKYLMGKTSLHLSDFDIQPSKKIFGLIKISNEVIVNFRINFNALELTQIETF